MSRHIFCCHSQSAFLSIWWTKVKDAASPYSAQDSSAKKKKEYYLAQRVNHDKAEKRWYRLRASNHVAHREGEIEELIALAPVAPQALIAAAQKT